MDFLKTQLASLTASWKSLSATTRKVTAGVGISLGLVSVACILAGRQANGGYFAAYVKSKKRLDGHAAIVTGANSGCGFEIALELLRRGCSVIITCRSDAKAQDTITRLKKALEPCEAPVGEVTSLLLDLGSRRSADAFLADFEKVGIDVNIIVNNAGAWIQTPRITEDGIEAQWQVNYYTHFYVTQKLLPGLIKCAGERGFGRVVNLTSLGHQTATVRGFNGFLNDDTRGDIEFWKSITSLDVYGDTKCAQICHMKKLQEEVNKIGSVSDFKAASAHPGFVDTSFVNLGTRPFLVSAAYRMMYPFLKTFTMLNCEQGAQTALSCVLDDHTQPGGYHSHCGPYPTEKSAQQAIATKTDELYQKSLTIWQ